MNEMIEKLNAIILDSGQAGSPVAIALPGKKAALHGSKHVGGTCLRTRIMVASPLVVYSAHAGDCEA
ncbi:MAG TPA: hypothetical protein VFW25_05485 [Silvibacterium sp.]|nr:hypothetical protein [Silvibacterium sp.]